jgi:hypothetical protein
LVKLSAPAALSASAATRRDRFRGTPTAIRERRPREIDFTAGNSTELKNNGISCAPNDLIICKSATGITGTTCGGAANQIMSQSLVVAIIFSTGKNGASATGGIDEAANLNGDRVLVYHTPTPASAANGAFDDQMVWITAGELYGRMMSPGVLP